MNVLLETGRNEADSDWASWWSLGYESRSDCDAFPRPHWPLEKLSLYISQEWTAVSAPTHFICVLTCFVISLGGIWC